jgi:L-lactate dehydrogenase complex protein LldG
MSAKNNILKRLRAAQTPFSDVPAIKEREIVVSMEGVPLLETFIAKAEALSAHVVQAASQQDALDYILEIVGTDRQVLAWDEDQLPLDALHQALANKNISIADSRDGSVRVGITGVEAALAATGSIVVSAKEGRPRSVSLLPYVHIAIVEQQQILPHFEAWIAQQSTDAASFRDSGNHVVITGASRTADIGMELVLGAHGPAELHIIVL